jgi:LysM repeat protein
MSPTIELDHSTRAGSTSGGFGGGGLGGASHGGSSSIGMSSSGGIHESPSTSGGTTYTIQKGDMFISLAKKYGVSVKAIEAANPGVDANHLKVGKSITIPAASATAGEPGTGSAGVTSSHSASTRPSRSTASKGSAATRPSGTIKPGSTYTVKKGDTLGKIAESAYGDKKAWRRIFRANRDEISDADVIPVGTVLHLPI